MATTRLSAWLDSYGEDLRASLRRAQGQGYRSVEANAAGAELDPRAFSHSARRHLRKHLQDLGLQLGGLWLEYPGLGVADPAHADQRVPMLKPLFELSADLGVRQVGIGLSGFEDPQTSSLAREILAMIGDWADRCGVDATISDALDLPTVGAESVRVLGCPNLRVAVDTGRLGGQSKVVQSIADLAGAVHLRDVRGRGERIEEVPFGQGNVDFELLLAQIGTCEHDPSLIVRHNGHGGVDALRQGREYIESLIGRFGARP